MRQSDFERLTYHLEKSAPTASLNLARNSMTTNTVFGQSIYGLIYRGTKRRMKFASLLGIALSLLRTQGS